MTRPNWSQARNEMSNPCICGRCYDVVNEVFPANCDEKPELVMSGMYHCPDCGAMVLGYVPHPPLCRPCLLRQHPSFDAPDGDDDKEA